MQTRQARKGRLVIGLWMSVGNTELASLLDRRGDLAFGFQNGWHHLIDFFFFFGDRTITTCRPSNLGAASI